MTYPCCQILVTWLCCHQFFLCVLRVPFTGVSAQWGVYLYIIYSDQLTGVFAQWGAYVKVFLFLGEHLTPMGRSY